MPVHYYEVVKPPTGGELRSEVAKLRADSVLPLTLLGIQEVPESETQEVQVQVHATVHPAEGGMTISGNVINTDHAITMRISADPDMPASASMDI